MTRRYRATLLDRLMACVRPTIEPVIQIEMLFSHSLDVPRLRRAFELLLVAEPILATRFVPRRRSPSWEPLGELPSPLTVAGDAHAFERMRSEPMDELTGPQVEGCLLRQTRGDRLLLRVHHTVSDAGGTKEILRTLSEIYAALERDPSHRPPPNVDGQRSMRQVMRNIPLRAVRPILSSFIAEQRRLANPRVTHTLPLDATGRTRASFQLRHIGPQELSRVRAFGKRFGATVNDLLVTAFFRAMIEVGSWDGRSQLRLASTVDLRRYVEAQTPRAPANLSTLETIFLDTDPGAHFRDTLERVQAFNARRKASWVGLGSWLGLGPWLSVLPFALQKSLVRRLIGQGIRAGNTANGLTNLGVVDIAAATFDAPAQVAFVVTPPTVPPMLTAGISGYAGGLTLSAGIYPESWRRAAPGEFFDAVVRELLRGTVAARSARNTPCVFRPRAVG